MTHCRAAYSLPLLVSSFWLFTTCATELVQAQQSTRRRDQERPRTSRHTPSPPLLPFICLPAVPDPDPMSPAFHPSDPELGAIHIPHPIVTPPTNPSTSPVPASPPGMVPGIPMPKNPGDSIRKLPGYPDGSFTAVTPLPPVLQATTPSTPDPVSPIPSRPVQSPSSVPSSPPVTPPVVVTPPRAVPSPPVPTPPVVVTPPPALPSPRPAPTVLPNQPSAVAAPSPQTFPLCLPAVIAPQPNSMPNPANAYARNQSTKPSSSLQTTLLPSPRSPRTIAPPAKADAPQTSIQESQPDRPPNSWEQIWQQIVRRRDQERSRTSRGEICPVVPQFLNRRMIWRDRPMFIWQGNAELVSVYKFASLQPVWQQTQTKNKNSALYVGNSLKPGTQYVWKAETGTQSVQVIFQILGRTERDRITAQLNQLEMKLVSENRSSEERLLKRVQFFLDQDLLLDAIQEIYSVSQRSEDIQALQEKIMQLSCEKK